MLGMARYLLIMQSKIAVAEYISLSDLILLAGTKLNTRECSTAYSLDGNKLKRSVKMYFNQLPRRSNRKLQNNHCS